MRLCLHLKTPTQMSITLHQIWTTPVASLTPVLQAGGRSSSGDAGLDRIIVTTLYYNAGQLAETDRKWLRYPNFNTVM